MPALSDLIPDQAKKALLKGRHESLEHQVSRVPNHCLGIETDSSTCHYAMVLLDRNSRFKIMSGTSFIQENILALQKKCLLPPKDKWLIVYANQLRKSSRLRGSGLFFLKKVPFLKTDFPSYERCDDFAAVEYQNTLLPKINGIIDSMAPGKK